jgi:hypothetical protein
MVTRPANTSATTAPTATLQKQVKGEAAQDKRENAYGSEKPKYKDLTVCLQYLKDDPLYKTVKPLQITPNFADKEGRTNVKLEPGLPETIVDVRSAGQQFDLDTNGFKYVKAPTGFKEWSSQPKIAQEYLPELEALLRNEIDGCDEILFYDARIRQAGEEGVKVEGLSHNPFARQVHVDNTEKSVIEKIQALLEMKADYVLSGRARAINIWRPIKHPVYDCGLAITDGSKLQQGDVIECDRHRAVDGKYWDTMGVVKYRPGYQWYYCSEQAEEDVLLFKNYDSRSDGVVRTVLHTAFDVPPEMVPPNAPTRESIEVRALIFTYPGVRQPLLERQQTHPLAISLEAGNLTRVDEEPSITDRLRTDIDEADEVKDAVLLLRRQEIRKLERVRDALVTDLNVASKERDEAKLGLAAAREQLAIQSRRISDLDAQVRQLESELRQSHPDLRKHLRQSAKELTDARLAMPTSHVGLQHKTYGEEDGLMFHPPHPDGPDGLEKELLRQRIERQEQEIAKWKANAVGVGNQAVSQTWQAGVDEAVRREREKDAFAMKGLQNEIQRLQGLLAERDGANGA